MRSRSLAPLLVSLSCFTLVGNLYAEDSNESAEIPNIQEESTHTIDNSPKETATLIEPFTGRVKKNKVRLRLQPNFDSQSLKELDKDQLLVISGETNDFYAVQPLADMKAYVFRTYILDNVVEGTRVNIRLKPDLDAPIIGQLNSGDRVDGKIFAANNKWLELPMPNATRFFIAKDYIEKVGDADYIGRLSKRKEEAQRLLNTTKAISDAEIQKPFEQINLDGVVANYQKIVLDYKDFPEISSKAEEYLKVLKEDLGKRKFASLEQKNQQTAQVLEQKNKKLAEELQAHKAKLSELEQQLHQKEQIVVEAPPEIIRRPTQIPQSMAMWIPVENDLISYWTQQTGNSNPRDFYEQQKQDAFTMRGIVDLYNRPIKNKPGNYMLLNSGSKLPIAFLYSTTVNLQDLVGHEITLTVIPRPNNNFAFPAYFVLSAE